MFLLQKLVNEFLEKNREGTLIGNILHNRYIRYFDYAGNALKNEDQKDIRFGLLKTWQFAHPRNKSITGPFKRFSKMITKTAYSILLNHQSHNILVLEERSDRAFYQVEIISETGRLFSVDWVVSIVKLGKFKDCWMTSDVSLPVEQGRAI